ncbi:DJ-1 protein [Cenococcum geophilum 1.58]|uniref:DJ-1 protein n=1 Tax=Cenococcum geophilum 1.58 TaxID=794803 RepID=UPI00358F9E0D|nr:DJ-1 protein [Cenococcum geophilum 1.58]
MPAALILIADGTEEIEFVTPYDVLTRAGVAVKSAGVNLKNESFAICSRGVRILPDEPSIDKIAAEYDADILILPGGGPGAKTFCDSDTVLELVKQFRERGKFVGAICAGTTALVKSYEKEAGKVQKVTVTSHPSVEKEIRDKGWSYSSERVVVDGRVVTSRGPGTALLFALTIVEMLCGTQKREEVAGPMIPPATL